ncbi:BEN domain-containing protein 3 [Gadus chalcogrammus]|uniref:BEN domain-containing protein 3-like n=1 Tax=Gadus chalcogrammus TaxID=1042646 RepID=UPI0024C44407|nr:BEN domain-containing protein 3-like [Gadus chalcogrammus]XP_056446513.1 BEN domain-containing protein 3 [Gadus chalcogrammus]
MSSSKNGDISHGGMLGEEQQLLQDLKEETDDVAIYEPVEGLGGVFPGATETGKRTFAEMGSDVNEKSTSRKIFRVSEEIKKQLTEESLQRALPCLTSGDKMDCGRDNPRSRTSYRRPLFGISHRINEKRIAPSSETSAVQGGGQQHDCESPFTSEFHSPEENCKFEAFPGAARVPGEGLPTDAGLYPLIEKMFFILNTLNSSMTQLHSKVDLLSLEVIRIKKQIKPGEMVTEFQPPPQYLLTSEELHQLMEQTSGAGELGCRLLVHLFPELFKASECTNGCIASKRTLDSLHLQLIRNYVEVCFPLVKNNNVWQEECLMQINDLFNHFCAQKDMESARMQRKQTIIDTGIKAEHAETCHFINEVGEEEHLSMEDQNNLANSDLASDIQLTDDLDEFSSPEDFVIFLVHRLFPEIFEEGKFPEGASGFHGVGQLLLESDRLEIIRKYMESNFPDVPEDTWLQVCVQHMEDAIESVHSNINEGEHDNISNNSYDLAGIPEDVSLIRIPNMFDHERPNRRSKKSLLVPVDFDDMEIPLPDFSVPKEYLLSKETLKSNYDCSLSIGNFASRVLVLMFPELFTQENARKHYNCSGSLGKKQLDPVRVNLIRHYVQLLYPQARNDRVWMFEFVGKLDERCRRRDTEQRRSYQQQRKVYVHEREPEASDADCQLNQFNGDALREDTDCTQTPAAPPEKSSKDFCKIPLDELSVTVPDFPVPSAYLLSDTEVREVVQQSLSVGNFAARLLVRLFPELFTQENLRLQYNHSGACNKKQLDPVRLRLIRHYVEAVYPVEKMEEVWHYECVPSIDERCRRPNRKKCDILKKAKRSSTVF